jgi:hypothetical protein
MCPHLSVRAWMLMLDTCSSYICYDWIFSSECCVMFEHDRYLYARVQKPCVPCLLLLSDSCLAGLESSSNAERMSVIYILSVKTVVHREKVNCCCDENIGETWNWSVEQRKGRWEMGDGWREGPESWKVKGEMEWERCKVWKRNRKRNGNILRHERRVGSGAGTL